MRRTAIVIVCLAVVVLAVAGYYFLHRGPAAKDSMPGAAPPLLSLLPPQAPYVVYADLETLRASAFLNQLIALVPAPNEDPEYLEFVRATGFDYARDLDRVAIAIFPTGPQPTVVTEAEGRFDQQKIIAYALHTGKAEEREGHTVYVVPASTPGSDVTVRFVAANRIELINRPHGDTPVTATTSDASGAAMKERINSVAGSPLFAVLRMDAVPKDATIGTFRIDSITSSLQSVQWLTLAAAPQGQDLRVVLEGECDSSLNAEQLNLALGGLRIMARGYLAEPGTRKQFTPQGADALTKLVRRADISAAQKRVQLAVSLTPGILDGLAAPTPSQKPQAPIKAPTVSTKPTH
jgi:hypothetical protein